MGMKALHGSDLTPDRLRTFVAVAECAHFTQAAARIHLTQSAVSRQIAVLERALGLRLFDRIGKTVRLTGDGQALLPEFRRILGDLARVQETVRGLEAGQAGRLRVGASATPGFYVLPRLLARFRKAHPGVELEYTVANTARIEELVVENAVDLGFVGGTIADGTLIVEPFLEDEIVCFASRGHRLAHRRKVGARDLADETIVLREEGSATRRLFTGWLLSAGGRIGRSIELGCPEAVKAVVAAGLGVGCLSRLGLRDAPSRKGFAALPIAAPRLSRSLTIVRHPRKRLSAVHQAFVGFVRAASAGAAAAG